MNEDIQTFFEQYRDARYKRDLESVRITSELEEKFRTRLVFKDEFGADMEARRTEKIVRIDETTEGWTIYTSDLEKRYCVISRAGRPLIDEIERRCMVCDATGRVSLVAGEDERDCDMCTGRGWFGTAD